MNSKEIKEIRSRLGMTQVAIAAEIGVTSNTFARWERGETTISDSAEKILRQLATQVPAAKAVSRSTAIVRDSYHNDIMVSLDGHLDGEVFEACATDLLRQHYPRLVPVRGGSDDGFDGAIAQDGGRPFPLITTVSKRVKDNLRRNLKQVRSRDSQNNRAIFATSRRITPRMRRGLNEAAAEFGVNLEQIYDQDWFANALYRNPSWCKALLNLTGQPPALSVFPISQRPILGDEVVGRDEEIERLRNIDNDCVLVGGPGSGKTFLLRALALEGRALFLVDNTRESVANSIREQQPNAIIFDDAHVDVEGLIALKQLRNQIDADFHIIATAWPTNFANVATALELARSDELHLELIDMDTMVDVVKSAGLYGPNHLIREIVRQAEGRPGLAASLAFSCLRGDAVEVLKGEVFAADIGRILDPHVLKILGIFGFGGASGLPTKLVADYVGKPAFEINSILASLAFAGVVRDLSDSNVSVWPEALRFILVRDTFFSGPGSLEYPSLIAQVPDLDSAILTLIGAKARGASVPDLISILKERRAITLWTKYAWLGPHECEAALREFPDLSSNLAYPALHYQPNLAIRKLLEMMATKDDSQAWDSSKPLDKLKSWAIEVSPNYEDVIGRRKTLVDAVLSWPDRYIFSDVSIEAMCVAMQPDFNTTTSDPGRGRQISFNIGLLSDSDLRELDELWPKIRSFIAEVKNIPWGELFDLLHKWAYPSARLTPPDETRALMRGVGQTVLTDLAELFTNRPGIQSRLFAFASRAGFEMNYEEQGDYDILFPRDRDADDDGVEKKWISNVNKLAERWSHEDLSIVVKKISDLETEANLAGKSYPRLTNNLCARLADNESNPTEATRQMIQQKLSPDLVYPMMEKSVRSRADGWEQLIVDNLADETYRRFAVMIVLTSPDLPIDLVKKAVKEAGDLGHLVETCCLRGEVSEQILHLLFASDNDVLAIQAAVGHWNAERRHKSSLGLEAEWRAVIIRSSGVDLSHVQTDYWIGEILAKDAKLARDWLVVFLKREESYVPYNMSKVAQKAISNLDIAQRLDVLSSIENVGSYGMHEIISVLVGDNIEMYKALLEIKNLERYHFAPLEGLDGQRWSEKALLALSTGGTPEEIARGSLPRGLSWSGPMSSMWAQWTSKFEELLQHPNTSIQQIGRCGIRFTKAEYEKELVNERHENVYMD